MAKYCPIVEKRVVYLTCQECEDKICFKHLHTDKSDAKNVKSEEKLNRKDGN